MAISWNNVAAPNLGESNNLFNQAMQSLKDAGAGLQTTAKDYQTTIRNRNHAILQEYINSAKTPEELQSEAFNIGFKNLQATLANEFDPVKVNEYRDTRGDVLTKRAGDAVALEANKWNLQHNKDKAPTELALGLLNLTNAQMDADFKAKNNPLVLDTNTVARDVALGTKAAQIETPAQALIASKHGMKIADGQLAVSRQNANTAALSAAAEAARKASGGDVPYAQSENGILDDLSKGLASARRKAQEYDKAKHPYASEGDWQDKEFKDPKGKNYQWLGSTSAPSRYITDYAKTLESFNRLPKHVQASVLDNATDASRVNDNIFNSQLWYVSEDNKTKLRQYVDSAVKSNTLNQQNALLEETSVKQLAVTQLMRVRGYDEQTAKNIVDMETNRVPKPKEPDKKDLPLTEQERAVNEVRKQKLTPSKILLEAAKNAGGLGGDKPRGSPQNPRNNLKLSVDEEARLSMLSEYATLKEKVSASTPNPENTLAFQKAAAGLDLENAKLGKLDSLTADRYVADIQAKLQRKNLDPLARAQQERLLKIFQANQKNFKGGD